MTNSSFGGTYDDNGLVMRLFGTVVFVVDGLVMNVFALELSGWCWSCKTVTNWFWLNRWSCNECISFRIIHW